MYSLGVVFFEMLTGSPPFRGDSAFAVLRSHALTPPPIPSSLNYALPEFLDRIVLRRLSKQPAARPTAEELLNGLSDYLAGREAGARAGRARRGGGRRPRGTSPPTGRVRSPRRRHGQYLHRGLGRRTSAGPGGPLQLRKPEFSLVHSTPARPLPQATDPGRQRGFTT
jgi:serine/threonine protein kinase